MRPPPPPCLAPGMLLSGTEVQDLCTGTACLKELCNLHNPFKSSAKVLHLWN